MEICFLPGTALLMYAYRLQSAIFNYLKIGSECEMYLLSVIILNAFFCNLKILCELYPHTEVYHSVGYQAKLDTKK